MKPISKLIGLALCIATIGLYGCGEPKLCKGIVVEKYVKEYKSTFPLSIAEPPKYYIRLRPLREDGFIEYKYHTIQVSKYDVMMHEVGDTIQFVD